MKGLTTLILLASSIFNFLAQQSTFIHVDQFGYLVDAPKVAVISNPIVGYNADQSFTPSATMELRIATTDVVVWTGSVVSWNNGMTHNSSGDQGWWLDFSDFATPGTYYLYDVQNDESSGVFDIGDNVYGEVLRQAGRMFFYNRCNFPKQEPYAESSWVDGDNFNNPGQDFNCRYIYDQGNEGLEKDLSGGWFDAGDYNKYITFTVGTIHNLLSAYEANPSAFGDNWNIPESGNGIPDILDEIKWELDWCMKMINADGSVHIKMGNRNYEENVSSPPSANFDGRYYGPTCTSASASIASTFSHAAIVYGQIASFTSYASELNELAVLCYDYTLPLFENNNLQTDCDDGSIVAGDADMDVENQTKLLIQAAVYLFEMTSNSSYETFFIDNYGATSVVVDDYWEYNELTLVDALLRYANNPNSNALAVSEILNSANTGVSNNWEDYFGFSNNDLYRAFVPDYSFSWGSNLTLSNAGSLNALLSELNIADDSQNQWLKASEQLHYFHGVNPLGIVYLSNMYDYGAEYSANEIYHSWFWEGTEYSNALTSLYGPAPGFLSGGANQWYDVEEFTPPSGQPPMKSYLDFNNSWPGMAYSITEPAIYYQAAYIRLLSHFVESSDFVGIQKPSRSNALKIYPNPSRSLVTISGLRDNSILRIMNKLGEELSVHSVSPETNQIDISILDPGIYFFQLEMDKMKIETHKLVVN